MLLAVDAHAVIAVDNVSTVVDNNPTTLTVSHATGAGSDRLMLVGVSLLNEDFESVISVTYNGTGLSFVGQISQGNDSRVELWSYLNPPTTTANVVVTFNEQVQSGAILGVTTFTGIDQGSPYGAFQSNSGDSNVASATVSSTTGELVFGVMAAEQQDNPATVVGGTSRWTLKSQNGNNRTAGAGATFSGATSVTLTWNLFESDDWAIGAISLRDAGGPLSCDTFRDEFSTISYSRQDGTVNWAGNWNEVGDNGSPNNGDIQIGSNSLQLEGDGSAATALGGPYIEREADLSTYVTATLSFDYRETGNWEPSDDIEIYVSDDGGTSWNLIQTFSNDQGASFQNFSIDIGAYMSNNTRIAFVEKANNSAEVFYFDNVQIEACSAAPGPLAYYEMNEASWNGSADEVTDSSGSGNDGTAVGSANTVDPGKICLGGDIPFNNSDAVQDAIDTELDMDADIGTTGTISFWYKPDTAWTGGGDRMLVDASTTADNKYFFLALLDTGALRFRFEDSVDADFQLDTTAKAFPAGEWHHIAVTWDLPGDRLEIYLDGVLDASSTPNTSGSWGALGTVYLGDNRSTYHPSGTPNSANGVLDEARIYNVVQSATQIQTDMNDPGSCLTPYAWFQLDANPGTWNGSAGEVVDQQATVTTAFALGTGAGVDSVATPICRGIDIPLNTTNAAQYGFDSSIDLNDDIGNTGTINFWYKSDNAWAGGGDRALFDASPDSLSSPDKFFLLMLRNDGALQFAVEDSADNDFVFNTAVQGFAANVWVHIAVTWNMSGNREIFINGVLAATDTRGTTGALGELDTIYFGDNRSTYHFGGTANSANGVIDEVRVYRSILTLAQINTDLNATHSCAVTTDHLSITHDGMAINCQPENVTVSAHSATGPHDVDITYSGTVSLSVDTGHGDWSYVSGGAAANLTNLGNGNATYLFDGSESGSVVLALANTFAETIDIDASDGSYTETSGTADATDDPPLTYDPSGFSFLANGVASSIGTQIAGKGSDVGYGSQVLELEAINTNTVTGACEAALTGVVPVEIAFECENANTCQRPVYLGTATPSTQVNGTDTDVVNPLVYSIVSLDFGSAADTTATFVLNYPDAGQIQLHARYALLPSGEDLMGASNSFVVRPFGFDIDVPTNPFPPNPVPPYETSSIFTSAGTGFTVDVAGALWNSADDNLGGSDGIPDNHNDTDPSNNDDLSGNTVTLGGTPYTGTPNFGQESEGIELTSLLFEPAGGNDPGLQGNTTMMAFSGGSQSLAGVVFNEVGIIEIATLIADLDYLGIGVAESGRMTSKSGYLGRFTPARLAITTLTHGRFANANVGGAVPFTYIGQDFGYEAGMEPSFVVSALNLGGGVTQNYTGDWDKLTVDSANFTGPTADSTQNGSDGITPMALTYTQNTDFNLVDNGDGTFDFEYMADDDFNYTRDSNSQVPPFAQDIDLVIVDVTDGDTITTLAGATLQPLPPATPVNTQMRFGRLRMENAFGSELSDLIMNYYVEFYDQIGVVPFWTLHDDVDTSIGFGEILEAPGNTAATAINPTVPLGKFEITLSATLIDVTETITIPVDTSGEPWLQYDWDQDGLFDNNPSALATFGIFDGDPVQIYIQQIYE